MLDYLAELSEPNEPLSAETLAGIQEGLDDVRNGRTMSADEYRRTRGLSKYEIRLSHRAQRDLDRLDKPTQKRIVRRLEHLAEDPYDPRLTAPLSGHEGLRKSRVGAWRIIYQVRDSERIVFVLMIERRGQVYKRI